MLALVYMYACLLYPGLHAGEARTGVCAYPVRKGKFLCGLLFASHRFLVRAGRASFAPACACVVCVNRT